MVIEEPHDEPLDEPDPPGNDALRANAIRDAILSSDRKKWREGGRLDLADGLHWTPHVMSDDASEVVHIHLSDSVPDYVRRRVVSAATDGHKVRIALTLEALYDSDVLRFLSEVDASLFVVIEDNEVEYPDHHLAVLGDYDVPVDIALRTALATRTWKKRAEGTNNEKGRRLEALLAFLLSQVSDFAIFERNFRGDTDEIDIVVQIVAQSGRCWREEGVPFILVEAKNWSEPAGQPQLSILIRHMETRRGRVRIGMFFSADGFTSDARDEVLKLAATPFAVAMVGPTEIEAWIAETDPDRYLEELVGRAMLR